MLETSYTFKYDHNDQYMYQVSHTQHQFLFIYSRLRVSAVIASHHQAFYINVDIGNNYIMPEQRSRYSDSLWAGRITVEASYSVPVQTSPDAQPASCTRGTGGKAAGALC